MLLRMKTASKSSSATASSSLGRKGPIWLVFPAAWRILATTRRSKLCSASLRETATGNTLFNNQPGEICQAAGDCQYVYSRPASQVFFNEDERNSVYRVRIGLRYEF